MKRKAGLLAMLTLALSACAGRAYVVRTPPPPPPYAGYVGRAPGPQYVWTDGYWAWHGRWQWMPGRWVAPPRPHAVWVPGRWDRGRHGYVWHRGHWR